MWIGWLEFDLLLGDVRSLKQKRSAVRPVIAELQRRFAVSGGTGRLVSGSAGRAMPQATASRVSSAATYTAPSSLENKTAPRQGGSK